MSLSSAAILERNAVKLSGEGPPMLLMHGFGCDQAMWSKMAPSFAADFQVIQYDLTGMGLSDYHAYDLARHSKLEGHADDLIEIIESVKLEPMVVVAHSVSSVIAGLAAIKRPDLFKSLVMIGPSPCYVDKPPYRGGFSAADIDGLLATMEDNYAGWAGQLASMVAGTQESDEAEGQLRDRFCRNDPEISRHFARVTFLSDNRDDLRHIKIPTLIIQSSRDIIAQPFVGEYVNQKIAGSKLALIDCTGHAPHMTHPEATSQAVRDFLAA
jgi:sigma-B regulation protein RsbQ